MPWAASSNAPRRCCRLPGPKTSAVMSRSVLARGADLDSLGGDNISTDVAATRDQDHTYLGRDHRGLADLEGSFAVMSPSTSPSILAGPSKEILPEIFDPAIEDTRVLPTERAVAGGATAEIGDEVGAAGAGDIDESLAASSRVDFWIPFRLFREQRDRETLRAQFGNHPRRVRKSRAEAWLSDPVRMWS